jgi:uncharacterized RDD family membrane protein YckC
MLDNSLAHHYRKVCLFFLYHTLLVRLRAQQSSGMRAVKLSDCSLSHEP